MKLFKLILATTMLHSLPAYSSECPDLAGQYFCKANNKVEWYLKVIQSQKANSPQEYQILYKYNKAASWVLKEVYVVNGSNARNATVSCNKNKVISKYTAWDSIDGDFSKTNNIKTFTAENNGTLTMMTTYHTVSGQKAYDNDVSKCATF